MTRREKDKAERKVNRAIDAMVDLRAEGHMKTETISQKLDGLFPVTCYICGSPVMRAENPRMICPNTRCKANQNDAEANFAMKLKGGAQ